MEWKTKLSKFTTTESIIRGFDHNELMGSVSFTEMIFILLKGRKPSQNEVKMLDALLVSSIDHGLAPPSVIAARSVISGGNPIQAGVAAGISTLGDHHGGAIEKSGFYLKQILDSGKSAKEVVSDFLERRERFPGFGHKIYKDFDPRTKVLSELAKSLGIYGECCELAFEIEREFYEQKGKKLCLNIDGIVISILIDMGFDPSFGKVFFIIARAPGLCAHAHEEFTEEKPFRRLDEGSYEYLGE